MVKKSCSSEIKIRIPYADTDQMGMVYYANYLVYFERGRTEWLRDHGLAYKELEKKGYFFPVMQCSISYISPLHYDELIQVRTTLAAVGFASIEFNYEIIYNDKIKANGSTKHPLVNKELRPVRLPVKIRRSVEVARG